MSGFDSNPFADPMDVNPFQVSVGWFLPANRVSEAFRFLGQHSGTTIPISAAPSQPAVLQTSVEQNPKAKAAAAQANLIKQQEELERKAAELERKEQELENRRQAGTKENNWPPLPRFFPIKPCFYQNFEEEIPEDYRRMCKRMYYLWMCIATLFLNVLACLACFTIDSNYGVDFGLAILWFILFTPVAFVCWYRPVYKAFRYAVSLRKCEITPFFLLHVSGFDSGWITSITIIKANPAVAVVMMVVAGFFTVNSVLAVILLKMVHSKYRNTGASFTKAQQEFSQGVLSNRTVQNAATSAATSAAQGAFGSSQN
uniref:Secretory carrier-associated membrane protein n=1 Tax=Pundamilia nyererei TaxID=303518 RepID=A0A3B4FY36_9CICH